MSNPHLHLHPHRNHQESASQYLQRKPLNISTWEIRRRLCPIMQVLMYGFSIRRGRQMDRTLVLLQPFLSHLSHANRFTLIRGPRATAGYQQRDSHLSKLPRLQRQGIRHHRCPIPSNLMSILDRRFTMEEIHFRHQPREDLQEVQEDQRMTTATLLFLSQPKGKKALVCL